jgi:ElaB/YqjD/DUF883 family membrane-anchored ribosome-binding protein
MRDMFSRLKRGGRSKGKAKDDSKASGSIAENGTPNPGTTSVSNVTTKSKDHPGDQMTGSQELCPISELWNQAYEDLKSDSKDQKIIDKYEGIIATDLLTAVASTAQLLAPVKASSKDNMLRVLNEKMSEVKDNKWRLRFHNHEVLVEDLAKPVINMIDMADKYVSDAVSANPYASIAWAGVGLILPVSNPRIIATFYSFETDRLDLPQSIQAIGFHGCGAQNDIESDRTKLDERRSLCPSI